MKVPKLTPVKSSNIEAVGFDAAGLHVKFRGGTLYTYPGADAEVHRKMLEAPSIGAFFASEIRGKFRHEKHDG